MQSGSSHGGGTQRPGEGGTQPGSSNRDHAQSTNKPLDTGLLPGQSSNYSDPTYRNYFDFGYFPFSKAKNQHQSQAVLNQQAHDYTMQQMTYSAELQADAEKRAQLYNDPRALKARGAAAGYSPEAMLGSAGGYEMGVSSAPSAPGASSGSGSDGGLSLGNVLGAIASVVTAGTGVASGVAGVAESRARKTLIDAQARRETLGAMRDMVDTVLYPRLAMLKFNDNEAKAISNVIKANMDYSWFNSYDENGTPLWKREKLEQLRGIIKNNVKLDADSLDRAMSAFKSFADGNLSFTQADDLEKTRSSRIDQNEASARVDNAEADFKETVNDDYKETGITPWSTPAGSSLIARRAVKRAVTDLGIENDTAEQVITKFVKWAYKGSIVDLIIVNGRACISDVSNWLKKNFPKLSDDAREKISSKIIDNIIEM